MSFYDWNDFKRVGVDHIDHQHEMLFGYINELHTINEKEINGEKIQISDIAAIFDKLNEYTIKHFEDEESLMREIKFPGYLRHKQVHDTLRSQQEYLKKEFERVGRSIVPKMIAFLGTWLQGHINHTDQEICHFINEMPKTKVG